jgi:hypothetical protein
MNAEIEVLDDLVKHARKLALARDPKKRIAASNWEIFFADKLTAAQREETQQAELFNAAGHDDDETPMAVGFAKQPATEGSAK